MPAAPLRALALAVLAVAVDPALAADQGEPLRQDLLQVGDGPALAQHVPVAARWLDLLRSRQVRGRGERNSAANPAFPSSGNLRLGGERNAKVMPLRAVKSYLLAWCQVRVTVILIARCPEPGAAQCTFGHNALPPRRSAFTDINAGYADKIPALPSSNRGVTGSVEIRSPRVPLLAGREDVAQGDGLVGHDAVDAQVEQPF